MPTAIGPLVVAPAITAGNFTGPGGPIPPLARSAAIYEYSYSTGTGTYTLAGAYGSYFPFSAEYKTGDPVVFEATDHSSRSEIVRGTFDAGSNTLTRSSIIASSNNGAPINWSGATRILVHALVQGLPLCPDLPQQGDVPVWDATKQEFCPQRLTSVLPPPPPPAGPDDDTADMQDVTTGVSYTAPINKVVTQIVWLSTTPGSKTTVIPACSEVYNGYSLDIKTTESNSDVHCVTPQADSVTGSPGTIGGISSFKFTDTNCNLSLRCDGRRKDWIVRCLCCTTPTPCTSPPGCPCGTSAFAPGGGIGVPLDATGVPPGFTETSYLSYGGSPFGDSVRGTFSMWVFAPDFGSESWIESIQPGGGSFGNTAHSGFFIWYESNYSIPARGQALIKVGLDLRQTGLTTGINGGVPIYQGYGRVFDVSSAWSSGLLGGPIGWNHVMVAYDLSIPALKVFVNDKDMGAGNPIFDSTWPAAIPFSSSTDFQMFGPRDFVRGAPGTGYSFHGGIVDAWFDPTVYLDPSVPANRRFFVDACVNYVDSGNTGQIPLGHSPAIFLRQPPNAYAPLQIIPYADATSIYHNKGTAGGFNLAGNTGVGPEWKMDQCCIGPYGYANNPTRPGCP